MSEPAANSRPSMVQLDGVSKRYGAMQALHETDLVVAEGEFVTLLGPSGSGKTTLLNLIAGTVAPTSGRVVIAGRDVTHVLVEKRGLGMVFQNYALMPHMTIFENIAFPLRVRRVAEDRDPPSGRRGAGARAASGCCRTKAAPAFRRAAAACQSGSLHRLQPGNHPDGRTAGRARQEVARVHAARDPAAAREARHHDALRNARSGGGIDHVRPYRAAQSRAHRTIGRAR